MVVISLGILVTMCNAVYIVPARGDFSRQILAGGLNLNSLLLFLSILKLKPSLHCHHLRASILMTINDFQYRVL